MSETWIVLLSIGYFLATLSLIAALYIGHSIIARSVLVGIEKAVREMKKLIDEAHHNKKY